MQKPNRKDDQTKKPARDERAKQVEAELRAILGLPPKIDSAAPKDEKPNE